ncbi:hypothetical protein G7Y89_g4628 [Cudoniella acicularis]|uniref:peptidylprolyl isomerase n=1 Tax=Cudoniella acicularis TaxID=354080 RepID=A0A8H4RP21_9HELO|nr:hypothetical protein G7Y89_g4628 [Cudoniella acicularis]
MTVFNVDTIGVEVVNAFPDQVSGKTTLITGPSGGGIGAECALTLARANPHCLILAGRSPSKAAPVIEKIHEINSAIQVVFIELDMLDNQSIREAMTKIKSTTHKIDILINNAGVMAVRNYAVSKDGVESQFAACYLGHFLLTNLLLKEGLLGRNGDTIVNVGSLGYQLAEVNLDDPNFQNGKTYNPWKAYGQAKTAQTLFNVLLAKKLEGKGVAVLIVQPGVTLESKLLANSGVDNELFADAYKLAIERNDGKPLPPQIMASLQQCAGVVLLAALDPALRVPFPRASAVSALAAEIKKRILRLDIWPDVSDITLHLGPANGPILDPDDLVSDVIADPKFEIITVTSGARKPSTTKPEQTKESSLPPKAVKPSGLQSASEVKLRIITPALARAHQDVRHIPIVEEASITPSSTLRDLNTHVHNFLTLPLSDSVYEDQECNCSFSRQIRERGIMRSEEEDSSGSDTSKVFVVHGRNQVRILNTTAKNKPSIMDAAIAALGAEYVSDKNASFISGGVSEDDTSGDYCDLPVLSLCSKNRHRSRSKDDAENKSEVPEPDLTAFGRSVVDIHTSEAPIELSQLNLNLTLQQLGLIDLTINGVLDIFVVERKVSHQNAAEELGKDAIFLNGDAWGQVIPQSKRGMSMLLSALRVFTGLIGAKHMDIQSQDPVIHVFNLLTRFPPAVRALHILMNGKTPQLCDRAAFSQSICEVLKELVPRQLINTDNGRVFEGARLLFGLILENSKHLKLADASQTPYISALKVLDLRNTFTMEPIAHPVQTSFGLVERGYYEALKEGGMLSWKTGEAPLSALPLDTRTRRIALLCGGIIHQITTLDTNLLLNSVSAYSSRNHAAVINSRELSDLQQHAVLCSRNNLSVLAPSTLPSAQAPALTLDRLGNLAVYVGRPPCADPGKDIAIFRPTDGGEENVDVSIITQLLVPILEKRESDGTAVFDAFGDNFQRKSRTPDEIIMLCVDCSASMRDDNDFSEIKDDDGVKDITKADTTSVVDSATFIPANLDERKTLLSEHESIDDILCIIHNTSARKRQEVAEKILQILSGLYSKELSYRTKKLEELRRTLTYGFLRAQSEMHESSIAKLKTFIAGLVTHEEAICDFLIYRATNAAILDVPWTWSLGDEIPQIPTATTGESSNPITMRPFSVPPSFLCPISQELMNDPVNTCDGFTFERNNIERWFQIRQSSPLTGLSLENAEVVFNGQLANDINKWIQADHLIATAPRYNSTETTTSRQLRSSGREQTLNIRFFSRLGSFTREVPKSLTVTTLYRIAFQGIKGRHTVFELNSENVFLAPSAQPISSTNLHDNSIVHINARELDSLTASADQGTSSPEVCLVKVYENFAHVLFSYWTPKNTTKTLASVVFRYWRYRFNQTPRQVPRDFVIWTELRDQGDTHIVGSTPCHWEPLSTYLKPSSAMGKLKDEKVYDPVTPDNEDVDMNGPQPLVLKILLGGEGKKKRPGNNLSRLDVLKTMFDAFVNRILAYNFQTHLGLITFKSSANVAQEMTHAVEIFRHKLNNMDAAGDTALWEALALANDQLSEYQLKFPKAKKRIICISDGRDTNSKKSASEVSWGLFKNGVVVDSFSLGNEDNVDLRTLSYLSGGYKFKPQSLEQAMAICEMEPVLSQLERPSVTVPPEAYSHGYDSNLRFVFAKDKAIPETITRDVFPQRKEHPNLKDQFVQLSTTATNVSGGSSHSTNLRTSRIPIEIRQIVANPHPHYDVYASESNMAFWKVVMQGPPESAYSDGVFILYLDMEEDYPTFAPKCRFVTPIYHPNINRHGKVCHSILDRNWTSDTTNLQVINTIYSLLLVPEFSDPINAVVTLNFHWDEVAFRDEAKTHIQKHATKTRAEWKAEILNE